MFSFFLAVILFLPIVSTADVGVDFDVTVCATVVACGDTVPDGLTLHVSNEAHPDVGSVPGGEFVPYSAQFPVPTDGHVFVPDVGGGLFDVYVMDADGNASAVPVNPVVSSDEDYVLRFNVMMPPTR